jgi:hypothetical protein
MKVRSVRLDDKEIRWLQRHGASLSAQLRTDLDLLSRILAAATDPAFSRMPVGDLVKLLTD